LSTSGHRVLSPEQFKKALGQLSKIDKAKLLAAARVFAFGTDNGPDDLLQEAIARTLAGIRTCPERADVSVFLKNAMRSIAYSDRKVDESHNPFISLEAEAAAGREISTAVRTAEENHIAADDSADRIAALEELFTDDANALTIVMGDVDGMSPEELQTMTGLDKKQYASARRRIKRKMAQAFPNGWSR
jgi:DNA-directed RNA polymerase specialized sigma24 family protein